MPDMPDPVAEFFGIVPEPTHKIVSKPHQFLDEVITLPGHPYVKKNNQTVVKFTRKDGSVGFTAVPTKSYKLWLNKASADLGKLGYPIVIDEPINMECHFYLGKNYTVDLSALYEAPQDLFKTAGIIKDDNYTIIASHDGSFVKLEPSNPRIEIILSRRPVARY